MADIYRNIPEVIGSRFKKISDKYIQMIAKRLKEIKSVDLNDVHALFNVSSYRNDTSRINRELSDLCTTTVQEFEKVLDKVADESEELSESQHESNDGNVNNSQKRLIVAGAILLLARMLSRVQRDSNSVGVNYKDENGNGSHKTIEDAYKIIIEEAIRTARNNPDKYDEVTAKRLRELSDSGIRYIDTESDNSERIESAVRDISLESMKTVHQNVQSNILRNQNYDGYEISAHYDCALDHLPYQGRQYSYQEFEDIQNSLNRQFGQWNCRHYWWHIVLGVTPPAYSEEQLSDMELYSTELVEYNGKLMPRYQANQRIKSLKSRMKKSEDRLKAAKAEGNEKLSSREQRNITNYKNAINDLQSSINSLNNNLPNYIHTRQWDVDYDFAKDVYKANKKQGHLRKVDIAISDEGRKYVFESTPDTKGYKITPDSLDTLIKALPDSLSNEVRTVEVTTGLSPQLSLEEIKDGHKIIFQARNHTIYIWGSVEDVNAYDYYTHFIHETGHLLDEAVGKQYSKRMFSHTEEWLNVLRNDAIITREYVSAYVADIWETTNSLQRALEEDFAESVRLYLTGPESFQYKFPNRYSLMKKLIK